MNFAEKASMHAVQPCEEVDIKPLYTFLLEPLFLTISPLFWSLIAYLNGPCYPFGGFWTPSAAENS
jgi:hypothetical protein